MFSSMDQFNALKPNSPVKETEVISLDIWLEAVNWFVLVACFILTFIASFIIWNNVIVI